MKAFDPSEYTIIVKKQIVDEKLQFAAQAIEFPYLYVCGDTFQEAYESAIETIAEFHEDAEEDGDKLPDPLVLADQYTGRITLRMPKSLHKQVDILSQVDGTSLNQFIVNAVSSTVSRENHNIDLTKAVQKFLMGNREHLVTTVGVFVTKSSISQPNNISNTIEYSGSNRLSIGTLSLVK